MPYSDPKDWWELPVVRGHGVRDSQEIKEKSRRFAVFIRGLWSMQEAIERDLPTTILLVDLRLDEF